jgi:hypothetical protein
MAGVAVPAVLFAFWAMLDAIAWAPGVSPVCRYAELVPLAAGVLAALGLNLLTEELRASPGRITKCWRPLWGGTLGSASIRPDEVRDVAVASLGAPLLHRRAVQVVADTEVLHFGGALGRDAKKWVRDCIISVISR